MYVHVHVAISPLTALLSCLCWKLVSLDSCIIATDRHIKFYSTFKHCYYTNPKEEALLPQMDHVMRCVSQNLAKC